MILAGPARPAYFLNHMFWSALDWIFPPTCGGCGQLGERWCAQCRQQMERIVEPFCPHCGDPKPDAGLCAGCHREPPAYSALRSCAVFGGPIREALHRLKYQRDIGIGEALSKHLIELYNHLKWDVDCVVPVPLGARRLKERGYNQSSFLAGPLAYAIGKPYRPKILQRARETQSQVGLTAQERRANVENAFIALPNPVKGKTILVIDDVTTTGSTISACAQALLNAGASAVFGLTLARAVQSAGLQADAVPQADFQPTLSNATGGTYGS